MSVGVGLGIEQTGLGAPSAMLETDAPDLAFCRNAICDVPLPSRISNRVNCSFSTLIFFITTPIANHISVVVNNVHIGILNGAFQPARCCDSRPHPLRSSSSHQKSSLYIWISCSKISHRSALSPSSSLQDSQTRLQDSQTRLQHHPHPSSTRSKTKIENACQTRRPPSHHLRNLPPPHWHAQVPPPAPVIRYASNFCCQ